MSFFFCSSFFYFVVFVFYWKDLHFGFVFFNSFNIFSFWICILFENIFLSNLYKSSQMLGIFLFLFHVHIHNTNILKIFFSM